MVNMPKNQAAMDQSEAAIYYYPSGKRELAPAVSIVSAGFG